MGPSMKLIDLASRAEAATEDEQHEVLGDAAYALWGDAVDAEDSAAFWDRATRFVAKLRAGAYDSAALMLLDVWDEHPEWQITRRYCTGYHASIGTNADTVGCCSPALAFTAAVLRAAAGSNNAGIAPVREHTK